MDVGPLGVAARQRARARAPRCASSRRWSTPGSRSAACATSASQPLKKWRMTADVDARRTTSADGAAVRDAHIAMDLTFDALTPAVGVDGQGQRGQGRERGDQRQRRQGPSRAGRPLDAAGSRPTACATSWRRRARQPRQVVGPAALGRPEDVALVLDQHRRRHALRRHPHRHRRRATSTAAGCGPTASTRASASGTSAASSPTTASPTRRRTCTPPTSSGRVHELDADVFRVSPGPPGIRPTRTIVNEGLARWTYEGRTGYGISEYLHQLDAQARPARPHRVAARSSNDRPCSRGP